MYKKKHFKFTENSLWTVILWTKSKKDAQSIWEVVDEFKKRFFIIVKNWNLWCSSSNTIFRTWKNWFCSNMLKKVCDFPADSDWSVADGWKPSEVDDFAQILLANCLSVQLPSKPGQMHFKKLSFKQLWCVVPWLAHCHLVLSKNIAQFWCSIKLYKNC